MQAIVPQRVIGAAPGRVGFPCSPVSIRSTLACFALLALAGAASPAAGNDPEIDEIIVTGSRIPRPDFESASPIVTVSSDAFRQSASTSVEAVLGDLPQFVPELGETFLPFGGGGDSGGRATLQLRGLGAHSTLLLLDGKRLVPSFGDGAVDVNVIPSALIERVEIISGGASAVYGSDAVAGVVNFKLLQNFDGVQIDGGWSETDQRDGEEQFAGITAGTAFADGRGQLMGYLGYSERDTITLGMRDFSTHSLFYEGPGLGTTGPDDAWFAGGSSTVAEARVGVRPDPAVFEQVFARYGFAPGDVPYQRTLAVNEDGSVFTTGNSQPGSVANYRGPRDPVLFNDAFYFYNFNPWNYLQLPLERATAFARSSFDIDETTEVYAQLLYADYSADIAIAPTPAFSLYLPRANPYITPDLGELLDSRADPDGEAFFTKRFVELGPRELANDYSVYQAAAGIEGELPGDWRYEAYVQYGENERREQQQGNVLRSRVFELLFAADGGRALCGEFDVLRVGHIAPECLEFISVTGTNESGYTQTVAEFSATGAVLSLPAGELELALGALFKRDEYFYDADPIAGVFLEDEEPDAQGFIPADDIDDSDHNIDLYLEASVPLLANRPGVQSLELLLGYRHSDYESAGGADAWKAELLYRPHDTLRLRGSLQQAVRAPSVYELYLPRLSVTYFSDEVPDPCAFYSDQRAGPDAAAVESLCLAQGVPAELLADFVQEDDYTGVSGGNPELEPENADTVTLGFVLSPAFEHPLLADLQLSVDWYRIEVGDSIDWVGPWLSVPACFDSQVNSAMVPTAHWCGFFERDKATGQIEHSVDTLVNYSDRVVEGIDTQLEWRVPAGPGQLSLSALASWLDQFTLEPYHGLPPDERTGLVGGGVGGSQPEWKLNLRLRYDWRALGAGLKWRYIDAMQAADPQGFGWDYRVPSYDYFDLFAEYRFEDGMLDALVLRGGVENLTDEQPPLVPAWTAANTDPSQYDVFGRRFYLNASYRF